jgi:quinolinate synthase
MQQCPESDYCCTSANAVDVVRSIAAEREVLFLPDMFLGLYIEHAAGRHLDLWLGECHAHSGIGAEDVQHMLDLYPDAHLLCTPSVVVCARVCRHSRRVIVPPTGRVCSARAGMVRHARTCGAPLEVIGTEVGLPHRLHKEVPGCTFVPLREDAICEYMKSITLAKLYRALRDVYEVRVEPSIAERARAAIDRMLAVGAR